MHSNYIFHGNDFQYDFNGLGFYFQDGNPISYNQELHIGHHFDLVLCLNEVFRRICVGLNWKDNIPCPLEE